MQAGLFSDPDQLLERPPYVATFCAHGFDFTLMTIHVLFGDAKKDRRGELSLIASCAKAILAANGSEQDLIICGDFNVCFHVLLLVLFCRSQK